MPRGAWRRHADAVMPDSDAPRVNPWVETLEAADDAATRGSDAPDEASTPIGQLGRYRVLHRLGAGGMGVVYAARDEELKRDIALKILKGADASVSDPHAATERLLREARSLARLSHPNVVVIYDVGRHDDLIYIAMEYVEGLTLGDWASTSRPWSERADALLQAARGLLAAHRAGLIHRDFKPDNVIVGLDGRVRVLDFGLAKLHEGLAGRATADPTFTQAGALQGTPRYMAPEQLRGREVGPEVDQFAFCVTAYEVAYGRAPFGGEVFAEIAAAVLAGEPAEPPSCDAPPELWPVLARGLRREPEDRYESFATLLEAFEAVAEGRTKTPRVSAEEMQAARARARSELGAAFAQSRFEVEELEARLERLESARSPRTIAALVTDLPSEASPPAVPSETASKALVPMRPRARIFSILSSTQRRGHWVPGERTEVISVLGSAEIDLREVDFPPQGLEIHLTVTLGSVEIFVLPGVLVQSDCVAILGNDEHDEPSEVAGPDAPKLHLTGWVFLGSVEVKERLPGEGGWAARKRRKAALAARADRKALPPKA